MRYSVIRKTDISNGEGIGISLFIQGCRFQCPGCFNKKTWNFDGGYEWNDIIKNDFLELANKSHIKRISILGGEPLEPENLQGLSNLLKEIRLSYGHDKTIWLYSGYCWEQCFPSVTMDYLDEDLIMRHKVIEHCDVMVDGRYMHELRDITLPYRGSSNQRLIDVKRSLNERGIIDWISK